MTSPAPMTRLSPSLAVIWTPASRLMMYCRRGAGRYVLAFGMGVDVHGNDSTKAACRAVSDAIRHSSLPFFQDIRARGGKMLVDVTVAVPDPDSVKVDVVQRELPHGEVTIRPVSGGLRVTGADTIIACAAITVSVEEAT